MLALIAAMAKNRVIGRDNTLPWHLPADLQHFKQLTMGKPLIMGRATFTSLGRVLPGREHIVLSRNPAATLPEHPRVHRASDLTTALALAAQLQPGADVMVIGGAQIYALALPQADVLYLTELDLEPEGDAWFPALNPADWRVRDEQVVSEPIPHVYRTYERVGS